MMQCRDIDERMVDFLYQELDADEATAFRSHVDGCARCGAELAGFTRTREAMRSIGDVEPPTAVTNRLLHEAARRAPRPRAGLAERLHRLFQPVVAHPAWATVASLVIVAGVAGLLTMRGLVTPEPQKVRPARTASVPEDLAVAAPPEPAMAPSAPAGGDVAAPASATNSDEAHAAKAESKRRDKGIRKQHARAAEARGVEGGVEGGVVGGTSGGVVGPVAPPPPSPAAAQELRSGAGGGAGSAATAASGPGRTTPASAKTRSAPPATETFATAEEAGAAEAAPSAPARSQPPAAKAPAAKAPAAKAPAAEAPAPPAVADSAADRDESGDGQRVVRLHTEARQRARAGDCARASTLRRQILAIDPAYHRQRVVPDPAFKACDAALRKKAPSKAPNASGEATK